MLVVCCLAPQPYLSHAAAIHREHLEPPSIPDVDGISRDRDTPEARHQQAGQGGVEAALGPRDGRDPRHLADVLVRLTPFHHPTAVALPSDAHIVGRVILILNLAYVFLRLTGKEMRE